MLDSHGFSPPRDPDKVATASPCGQMPKAEVTLQKAAAPSRSAASMRPPSPCSSARKRESKSAQMSTSTRRVLNKTGTSSGSRFCFHHGPGAGGAPRRSHGARELRESLCRHVLLPHFHAGASRSSAVSHLASLDACDFSRVTFYARGARRVAGDAGPRDYRGWVHLRAGAH